MNREDYEITIGGKRHIIPSRFIPEATLKQLIEKEHKQKVENEILKTIDEICLRGVMYSSASDDDIQKATHAFAERDRLKALSMSQTDIHK